MIKLLADAADDPSVRVLIVTGEGKAFAAGADIDEMNAVFDDPEIASTIAQESHSEQRTPPYAWPLPTDSSNISNLS